MTWWLALAGLLLLVIKLVRECAAMGGLGRDVCRIKGGNM